jgi:hypothetical protein
MINHRIGNSRRQAINWTQDILRSERPLAEQTYHALRTDGLIVEDTFGVTLKENEEGVRQRARALHIMGEDNRLKAQQTMRVKHLSRAAKAAAKNRAGRRFSPQINDAAEEMIYGSRNSQSDS